MGIIRETGLARRTGQSLRPRGLESTSARQIAPAALATPNANPLRKVASPSGQASTKAVCACGGGCPRCTKDSDGPPDPGTKQGGGTTSPAIPSGVELAGNDHRSYTTASPTERARFRTLLQNQTLMRLTPAGDYRHGCVKEFLTMSSTTCPTTGAWAGRNPCSGNKCLDPGRYGQLGAQTDGPDTFFDNHRTRLPTSLLEGAGTSACSEVCHQRYAFRAAAAPGTYHDLGSFYVIRNFRADTDTDDQGTTIHVTTGSVNKVPAQLAAPTPRDFARNVAPGLAASGALAVPPPVPSAAP